MSSILETDIIGQEEGEEIKEHETAFFFKKKKSTLFLFLTTLFKKFIYFILFILAVLGPSCCVQVVSSFHERGATLRCGAQAYCGGFSCCRAWALGARASVVLAPRLSSCGLRALERRLSHWDA